ncbi:MAG: hypothetical protein WC071_13295, partial [Victivallaceae bacterium]
KELASLCAFGCGLGAVLGGPAAICRAILLGLALFAVIPVIEKLNRLLPKFCILQAGIIGACAGLGAGCLMALLNHPLTTLDMNLYETTPQTLIIFSGLYGLLVHVAFKATEKCHIAVRFLSVLLAMCFTFILRFHPLVFQTAQPLAILQVIAASVPSCIFIALFWWLPAEKLKFLYRPDLADTDNGFRAKWLNKINMISVSISIPLGLIMMSFAISYNTIQFKIENSNDALKKSLTGKIFTESYIYDCQTNKETGYQPPVSDFIKYCQAFDFKDNIICISRNEYKDKCTNVIFTDATQKQVKIDAGFVYISISPNNKELAGMTEDGNIFIYEINTGKRLKELSGKYADSLCWSPDGGKIFTVSANKKPEICRIDIASGSVETLFYGDMPRLIQCSGAIAYRDKNSIKIFSPGSGKIITAWDNIPHKFEGFNISPCGKYLIYLKNMVNPFAYPSLFLTVKPIYEPVPGTILGITHRIVRKNSLSIAWQKSPSAPPEKTENAAPALKLK